MDNRISHSGSLPLLSEDETPPFEIGNAGGCAAVVLVCDHARNVIPRALADLGLDADLRAKHIALDIGCEMLARRLAHLLDAVLVLARFSRLVIDLNRPLDDPTSISPCSDGFIIPGNQNVSTEQIHAVPREGDLYPLPQSGCGPSRNVYMPSMAYQH